MSNAGGRRPPVWALVSAAWLGPALLASLKTYVQGQFGSNQPASWRDLVWEGGDWLIYGLLTPVVFWFARRRTPLALAVMACVDSYWTEWRSPEPTKVLLAAGATLDGVKYPSGYAEVDELLKSHRATPTEKTS